MQLSILGRLEVRRADGTAVPVNGQRLRILLAALAAEPGRVVGTDRLIDALWGDSVPANAANALQALVYRLRNAVGRDAIEADPGGYRLAVEPDAIDAQRFARLVAEARGVPPAVARVLLKEALGLWRGPALADLDDPAGSAGSAGFAGSAVSVASARLEESRLLAVEDYAAACLADADPAEALAATAREVDAHPLREGLQARHIGALYALGRQADALRWFDKTRRVLADELGADPSAELAALHLQVLRGRPRRHGNLPAQLTSFVGRDADVAAVAGLLTRHRLVTLTGPGGAGKTRLAIETAARRPAPAADPVEGADSVEAAGPVKSAGPAKSAGPVGDAWLVELAPVGDPDEVVRTALAVLDVRDLVLSNRTMRSADPTTRLVEALADRRLLLILDNCEHVIDAAAGLVAAIVAGCPDVRVLATSREPLGVPGETLYPVPPLQLPAERDGPDDARRAAAVRLFTDRASAVASGFRLSDDDVRTVGQICRRLDGIPLAIELAAARLRLLSPRQIAERIDDRFRLLTTGPVPSCPGTRPCARWWTGAGGCSTSPSGCWPPGCRCSPAAPRWSPSRRCAGRTPSTRSPRWSTSRWSRPPAGGTGCWRRSGPTPPSGWPSGERPRRCTGSTPRISWRWRRRRSRGCARPIRWSGCSGCARSTTTWPPRCGG
ncbi:MAG TPA: BTAD domain-containing putative transcriptional regulator [Rugosimonospora sp.]